MHARIHPVHQDLNPPGRDDYRHYDYNDNNNIVHFCNSERVAVRHEMDSPNVLFRTEPGFGSVIFDERAIIFII